MVATLCYQGSKTGQEVIFDLFFCFPTFENLDGIGQNTDRCRERKGCNSLNSFLDIINAQSFQIKDLSGSKTDDAFKQFSSEFFDLTVVDECHRGSAKKIASGMKYWAISKLLLI